LVGKPEGKRPLGRPRRRWEDGIRMDLREIGLGGVDWIRLGQGPVAGCCECGDDPSGSCATDLVKGLLDDSNNSHFYKYECSCITSHVPVQWSANVRCSVTGYHCITALSLHHLNDAKDTCLK
jgi:hypothetical protein